MNYIHYYIVIFLLFTYCNSKTNSKAEAVINEANNSMLSGKVSFVEKDGQVTMHANIENATPGFHAIHIHETGDCSAEDATSAGGHWNPSNRNHGQWGQNVFHKGDIGNIEVDTLGKGSIKHSTDLWCISCKDESKNIIGKAIIIHEKTDDFQTQPTGAAGARIGCGVIK